MRNKLTPILFSDAGYNWVIGHKSLQAGLSFKLRLMADNSPLPHNFPDLLTATEDPLAHLRQAPKQLFQAKSKLGLLHT
jgi:hypothetical protein